MTKQSRYVLHQIQKLCKNSSIELYFIEKDNVIYKVHNPLIKVKLKKYSGEIGSLFDYLTETGYLIKTRFGFKLTHKGAHPYAVSFETVKCFLIKSFLVPIAVSIITTLLTLWLKGLLQLP